MQELWLEIPIPFQFLSYLLSQGDSGNPVVDSIILALGGSKTITKWIQKGVWQLLLRGVEPLVDSVIPALGGTKTITKWIQKGVWQLLLMDVEACGIFSHTSTWWGKDHNKWYRKVSDNSVLSVQVMVLDKKEHSSKDDSYFHHQGNSWKQMKSSARNWKVTSL